MNNEELMAENARLRRSRQADGQRITEQDIELAMTRPMAAAAHTLCSVFRSPETNGADLLVALQELLDVHMQQTPSPPVPMTGALNGKPA